MPQPVILCADDYALSPGVSRGILELIGRGRLSATGCMTVSPFWPEHALALRPWAGRVDVGLHLTLTGHRPLGPMLRLAPEGRLPPLGRLLRLALARRLDADEITAEVARQIERFRQAFGAPPAFIDGHQHVHLLPGVRGAVLAAARELPGCWLRDCYEPLPAILRRGVAPAKAALIAGLGLALHRRIERDRLPANGSFRGIYDFSGRVPFAGLMARFLSPAGSGGTRPPLVMVHPGFPDAELRRIDPVTDQRQVEYDFLAGEPFNRLLDERDIAVARLTGTPCPGISD